MTISIMVVEDESIVAVYMADRLRGLGCEVPCMVSTGEDAIRKAVELKPSLVFMDIDLKGDMDGIEAAVKIREQLNIPVVFVTAYDDKKTFERAAAAKPYGYIRKPFNDKMLKDCVEKALLKVASETENKK